MYYHVPSSILPFCSTFSIPPFSTTFFFSCSAAHLYLHSFPTRRSSDLISAMPLVGDKIRFLLLGGNIVGENALLRFYVLHDVDRKSTRLNSSHVAISYAVFCLKKKTPIPITRGSSISPMSPT